MWEPGEARRASLERNAENRSRLAFAGVTFDVPLFRFGEGNPTTTTTSSLSPFRSSVPRAQGDGDDEDSSWEDDWRNFIDQHQTIVFERPAEFDLSFMERPFVSTGLVMNMEMIRDWYINEYGLWDMDAAYEMDMAPQITGHVTEWLRNENGYYTGAWCAVVVEMPWTMRPPEYGAESRPATRRRSGVAPREEPPVQIDFSFRGIAMKDVEPEVRS